MINIYAYVWEMYADKILSDNSWRIQVCVAYIVTTGSRIRFHGIKFPPKTPFRRSQERYVQYGCIVALVMVMRRSINLFMGNRRSGGHFIPCKKDTACDRARNSICPVSKSRSKSLHAFGTQGLIYRYYNSCVMIASVGKGYLQYFSPCSSVSPISTSSPFLPPSCD